MSSPEFFLILLRRKVPRFMCRMAPNPSELTHNKEKNSAWPDQLLSWERVIFEGVNERNKMGFLRYLRGNKTENLTQ